MCFTTEYFKLLMNKQVTLNYLIPEADRRGLKYPKPKFTNIQNFIDSTLKYLLSIDKFEKDVANGCIYTFISEKPYFLMSLKNVIIKYCVSIYTGDQIKS